MTALEMPYKVTPVRRRRGVVVFVPRLYQFGSQPDYQVWSGDTLLFDPPSTDGYDLLHEVAHHIECRAKHPELMGRRNWGISPLYDEPNPGNEDVPEEEGDLLETFSPTKEEEDRELTACYIELAFHVLWETGLWKERAVDLNLFDPPMLVGTERLDTDEPENLEEWKQILLQRTLPYMREADVPEHLMRVASDEHTKMLSASSS